MLEAVGSSWKQPEAAGSTSGSTKVK